MMLATLMVAAVLGQPLPVTCDLVGHGGWYAGDHIALDPLVCAGLSKWANDRMLGVSIFTVAHESEHALGILDEHAADCAALPLVAPLARRFFGVTIARASRLAREALRFHNSLPPPYSGPC